MNPIARQSHGIARQLRITLLAAASWAAAAATQAQSITVYGVVDLFVGAIKVGGVTRGELLDGGNLASRIGVRGTEPLGNGHHTEFVLESSITGDTGASNAAAFWDRQVFVGLSGDWGRLRLGRQYSPHFVALSGADPFGANAVFSPQGLIFARDGQPNLVAFPVRMNNTVDYLTPQMGGLYAHVAYAFGEAATLGRRSGEGMSITLGLRQGGLSLHASASRMRSGTAAAPVPEPSKNDFVSVGGAYKLSALTVYGTWMDTRSSATATPGARHLNIGLKFDLGERTALLAGGIRRDLASSPRDATALVLGVDHALSRRTVLYGRLAALSNRGGAANGLVRATVAANSGDDLRALGLGLRHSF